MKKKYVISIIAIILLLIGIIILFFWPPKFELKNGENITLKYGQKYKEPGYKVTRFGKDYTKKVKVKNKINKNKLGTYEVIYEVKIAGINFKQIRKVKISDNEKPKITLKGDKKVSICPHAEYKEEGYSATDNYDGDLTKKVKITKKDNIITYLVKDTAGNTTKVKRTIIKEDKTAPVITLKQGSTITLYLNETWKEPGYTAIDNCDSDITNKVETSGNVNTKKLGTYKIIYSVTDEAGNVAKIERTVKVVNRPVADGSSIIYLTFDDGPKEGTTNVILDILKEENVKATFFVTNSGPDYLIKRAYDEGHTVGLHTASHNYQTVYSSVDNYYRDLKQVQNRVKRITGYESKIIRFPGGSSNTISKKYSKGIMSVLTKDTVNKGYRYYDWNISSGDAGEVSTASGVYNTVIKYLKKNRSNMILMHDIKPYTRDALRNIIKYGKNNGYTFAKITMSTPMITHGVNN